MVVGTPTYMSPEQASGEREIDGRTDIFALGCVLYELLAGEAPFHGPTPQATLMRRFTGPPRPLRPVIDVPEVVETAIVRALARDPKDRFATAAEFAEALAGRGGPAAAAASPQSAGRRALEAAKRAQAAEGPAEVTAKKGCFGVVVLAAVLAAGTGAVLLSS
jgi:serine/threonine-protein kinase